MSFQTGAVILMLGEKGGFPSGLRQGLEALGYAVSAEESCAAAVERVSVDPSVALMLADFPPARFEAVSRAVLQIKSVRPLPVIFLTRDLSEDTMLALKGIDGFGVVRKAPDLIPLIERLDGAIWGLAQPSGGQEVSFPMRHIIDHANTLIAEFDETGRLIYANRAYHDILGYLPEELIGHSALEFISPEENSKLVESYTRLLSDGASRNDVWRFRHRNGGWRFFECLSSLYVAEDGTKYFIIVSHDITERVKAERSLEEKTEELEDFFSLDLDLLCVLDGSGGFIRCNPAWERVFGYGRAELLKKGLQDLLDPRETEGFQSDLESLGRDGNILERTMRFIDRSGGPHDLEWRARAGKGRIYMAAREVTERLAYEERLRQAERRLAKAERVAGFGNWETISGGKQMRFSEGAMEICGLDHDLWDAEEALKQVMPQYREQVSSVLERVFKDHRPLEVEFHIRRPADNKIRIVHAIVDFHPVQRELFGVFHDITLRKETEVALMYEKERFRRILNSMDEGIYITGEDYNIDYANPAMERLFGNVEGRKCYEALYHYKTPCLSCPIREVFSGQSRHTEWEMKDKPWVMEVFETAMENSDGSFSKLTILHDITRYKQTEKALQQKIEEGKLYSELSRGWLGAKNAHEINEHLGPKIEELSGAAYVAISALDVNRSEIYLDYLSGLDPLMKRIVKTLGIEPKSLRFPLVNMMVKRRSALMEGHLMNVSGIYEVSGGVISKFISGALESILGITKCYTVGFVWEGKLFGGISFGFRQGTDIENAVLIEQIVRLVSNALQRIYAESMYRESEDRFSLIFEQSKAMMFLLDPGKGEIDSANPAVYRYFDYGPEGLAGKRLLDLLEVPAGVPFRGWEDLTRRESLTFNRCLANGEVRHLELRASPVKFRGKVQLFTLARDVTDRVRLQNEIENRNKSIKALVEAQSSILESILIDEGVQKALRIICPVFGLERLIVVQQLQVESGIRIFERYDWKTETLELGIGAVEAEITRPNIGFRKLHRRLRQGLDGWISTEEYPLHRDWADSGGWFCVPVILDGGFWGWLAVYDPNPSRNWNEMTVSILASLGDSIAGAIIRKDVEKSLESMNQALDHRVKLAVKEIRDKDQMLFLQSRLATMGEMLGNIAHQWRQPINVLGLLIQNMAERFERNILDHAYVEKSYQTGLELILHLSRTIDDFRDFFRPDKEKTFFNVADEVKRSLVLIESSFQFNRIRVETELDGSVECEGYPNEYGQVVLNLLNNSKEVCLDRKVNDPRIILRLSRRNGRSVLTVRDNGGGIPEEIIGKVFDPYFTTKVSGTGIGLYMSKVIVEKNMSGSLSVANVEGGAEFTVVI